MPATLDQPAKAPAPAKKPPMPYVETMLAFQAHWAGFVGPRKPRSESVGRSEYEWIGGIRFDADGTCHNTLQWVPRLDIRQAALAAERWQNSNY
jgi:hypothetical protein